MKAKKTILITISILGMFLFAGPISGFAQVKYTKEYQQKVKNLSAKQLKRFGKISAKHTRKSKVLTLRQVMFELESEFSCVISGILINNLEMVADCAHRASHHRFPKGGLFAYMELNLIQDSTIDWLLNINKAVEVNFDKIEALAKKGDATGAAALVGEIMNGCIACHNVAYKEYGKAKHIIEK